MISHKENFRENTWERLKEKTVAPTPGMNDNVFGSNDHDSDEHEKSSRIEHRLNLSKWNSDPARFAISKIQDVAIFSKRHRADNSNPPVQTFALENTHPQLNDDEVNPHVMT